MVAKPNNASRKSARETGKSRRHSKTAKKPVTIDLEPEKVVSKKKTASTAAGAAKSEASKGTGETKRTEEAAAKSAAEKAPAVKSSVPKTERSPKVGREASKEFGTNDSTPANPAKSGGLFGKLAAGIVGGVIALGGAAGLQYLGYFPATSVQTSTRDELNSKIAALETRLAEKPAVTDADLEEIKKTVDAGFAQTSETASKSASSILEDVTGKLAERDAKIEQLQAQLSEANKALTSVQSSIAAGGAGEETALAALSSLTKRMDAVSSDVYGLRDEIAKKDTGAGIAKIASIDTAITSLQGKVDSLDEALSTTSTKLAAVGAKTETLPGSVADLGTVTALATQLASVKSAVESVQGEIGGQKQALSGLQQSMENGADKKAARALAAAALKSDIDRGLPFANSLTVLKSVGGEQADIGVLESYSKEGIPSVASLIGRFDGVRDAVIAATTDVKDKNAFSRLVAGAKSFVKVKSVAPVEGDTPAAILSRIGAALTADDLQAAGTEWATLPEAGQAVSKSWFDDLQARITANSLMAQAVQSFMSSPNSSGAGN